MYRYKIFRKEGYQMDELSLIHILRTEQGLACAERQTIFVNEHRIVVEPVLFGNISKGVYLSLIHICS